MRLIPAAVLRPQRWLSGQAVSAIIQSVITEREVTHSWAELSVDAQVGFALMLLGRRLSRDLEYQSSPSELRIHTPAETFLLSVKKTLELNVTSRTSCRAPRMKQSEFMLRGTSSSPPCLSSASCNFVQFLCHAHLRLSLQSFCPPPPLPVSLPLKCDTHANTCRDEESVLSAFIHYYWEQHRD